MTPLRSARRRRWAHGTTCKWLVNKKMNTNRVNKRKNEIMATDVSMQKNKQSKIQTRQGSERQPGKVSEGKEEEKHTAEGVANRRSAPRSASRSASPAYPRPASPAAAAIATNRLASAFFARAFFCGRSSQACGRWPRLTTYAARSGERSGGGAHTGVCGLAHSVAPSCADEVPIEPSASARARISQLGSISESSDRAGLMR